MKKFLQNRLFIKLFTTIYINIYTIIYYLYFNAKRESLQLLILNKNYKSIKLLVNETNLFSCVVL